MPLISSDLIIRLSIKTGSAGESLSQADKNLSLGKYISTTELVGSTLNNLFDSIGNNESAVGDVEYRCLFLLNENDTITLTNAKLYILSEIPGGASAQLAVDSTAASIRNSSSAQALEIANEDTAPAGLTFTTPTPSSPLSLGNILPSYCKAFWIRRTVLAGTGQQGLDGITFRITGETA